MSQEYTNPDLITTENVEKPKLNSGLNVLTILTIIGCSVFGLLTLFMPMIYRFFLDLLDKQSGTGREFSATELAKMEKARAAIEMAQQNMVPLMVTGLLGIALCFVGALWMRKLRKDGYWLYVTGELLPLAASIVILGTSQFDSIWSILSGLGIPLAFVVLYTVHRKYLVK